MFRQNLAIATFGFLTKGKSQGWIRRVQGVCRGLQVTRDDEYVSQNAGYAPPSQRRDYM